MNPHEGSRARDIIYGGEIQARMEMEDMRRLYSQQRIERKLQQNTFKAETPPSSQGHQKLSVAVKGGYYDGEKGREAIYGWEKQTREEQQAIKSKLDQQWSEKMQMKRSLELARKLRESAKTGDVETLQALIDCGVSVNEASENMRNTPLHYACREGRAEAVQALINAKANLEARDSDSRTPLHLAASNGTASVIRVMCANGADLYAKCLDGSTPLDVANFWNNPETAPALRQLMGFSRRVGVKCEGFENGVQQHFSVQRVGVYPNTKCWR
mmetsp:Transcript_12242/g.33784  ORF Transcript_12242/g.33784 Transcript_12242/m.33784 type:complete len:271 (+) Transcript_12242:15-827(+)